METDVSHVDPKIGEIKLEYISCAILGERNAERIRLKKESYQTRAFTYCFTAQNMERRSEPNRRARSVRCL